METIKNQSIMSFTGDNYSVEEFHAFYMKVKSSMTEKEVDMLLNSLDDVHLHLLTRYIEELSNNKVKNN